MCVSNHEKCKKSGMVFELHIKIRSRAIFERQTTVVPKADGFLFFQEVSQTKDVLQPVPDQERTKSPLKRKSYLSVSMKGTVQYCHRDKCYGKNFSVLIAKYHCFNFKFCEKISWTKLLFVFNEKLTEFGFNWTRVFQAVIINEKAFCRTI